MTSYIERDFGEFTNLASRRGFFSEFDTGKFNNASYVENDESIQQALDDSVDSDPRNTGVVKLLPGPDYSYGLGADTLPITLPEGSILDLRRAYISGFGKSTAEPMFRLGPNSVILGHRAEIDTGGGGNFTGPIYEWSADAVGTLGAANPGYVLGFPKSTSRNNNYHLRFVSTGADFISSQYAQVMASGGRLMEMDNTGGQFINSNRIEVFGRVGGSSRTCVTFTGDAPMRENVVEAKALQLSSNTGVAVRFDNGDSNTVTGNLADLKPNVTTPVEWTANAGANNVVETSAGYLSDNVRSANTDASGRLGNVMRAYNVPSVELQNLSGKTATSIGYVAADDGTNTAVAGMPCVWVDTNADGTGDAWQPVDGSATFV